MLCYFHSWNSLSHSVPLLPSNIWHVSCEVRMGWAGCSGWQEAQGAESGTMLQVQVRSGALSSPQ